MIDLQAKRMSIYKAMENEGFEPVYNFGGQFQGIDFDHEYWGNSEQIYTELKGATDTLLYKLYEFLVQIEEVEQLIY